ncbi:ROK family transcriptional regulator [Leifsonia shinshuensis]|uniref:ROK family protein n=1 Tax=Leifsonia shinshuensis TaxID=150026 RepID=A0A7G6Y6B3_9MICO|nr:ROK family transcriptional regulator [Leifsonia shinshuensis]QNE34028.1 ROK family protein [Leifsonia shinshuensis]
MHKPNDVPQLIRRTHEERILATLRENGPLTRAELEKRVGLSRTTLSDITAALLRRGVLVERATHDEARGRGRPAAKLALDPASGQFLGVDLGHRRVHVAVVNASNEIIVSGERAYDVDTSWSERIDATFALIEGLARDEEVGLQALEGIGIGVPGPLSTAFRGEQRTPPRWRGQPRDELLALIRGRFAGRFSAPLTLDNNTRLAGLGEAVWGRADDADSLLYLRLGDGVGGGLVVSGRLVSGASGSAGEVGHVTVEPDGLPCWCGKTGCLETVASVPAIQERLAAVRAGDGDEDGSAADAVVRAAGEATGRALAAASVVVDPRDIVIAGDVLRFPGFLDAARESFARETLLVGGGDRLRVSTLRDEAGALGAIAAAFHRSSLLVGYASLAGLPDPAPEPADAERRQA